MTDTDEDMVLCGRGLDKWYGAKHERRQVLFGVDVDVRAGGVPRRDRRLRIGQDHADPRAAGT